MSKKKWKYTSIRVDPKLWKAMKIEAIKRDMNASELADIAFRKEIDYLNNEGESKD